MCIHVRICMCVFINTHEETENTVLPKLGKSRKIFMRADDSKQSISVVWRGQESKGPYVRRSGGMTHRAHMSPGEPEMQVWIGNMCKPNGGVKEQPYL